MHDFVELAAPAWLWILTVFGLMLVGAVVMLAAGLALKWAAKPKYSDTFMNAKLIKEIARAHARIDVTEHQGHVNAVQIGKVIDGMDSDNRPTCISPEPIYEVAT